MHKVKILKVELTQNMKIHLLSAHCYVDGGDVSEILCLPETSRGAAKSNTPKSVVAHSRKKIKCLCTGFLLIYI